MKSRHTVLPRVLHNMHLLAAITLMSAASSTLAANTSFASSAVSNLRYTLTDLTPGDGIAPSLGWTSTSVHVLGDRNGYIFRHLGDGSAPLEGSWTNGADSMVASFQPGTSFETTLLTATVHSDGNTGETNGVSTRSFFSFTVAAGTAVTFYSDYEMYAGFTDPMEGTYAYSYAIMELYDTGTSQDYYDSSFIEAATYRLWDRTGTASVSFSNTSRADWTGTLKLLASGQAFAGPLPVPVPEPSTYAMLGLGLLAVGAAARRRA